MCFIIKDGDKTVLSVWGLRLKNAEVDKFLKS